MFEVETHYRRTSVQNDIPNFPAIRRVFFLVKIFLNYILTFQRGKDNYNIKEETANLDGRQEVFNSLICLY